MMNPGVYVVEHKTTSFDIGAGSTYWKRLTFDTQNGNYLEGTKALGYEPVGVLYDVIKKPMLRPYEATPPEERKYIEAKSRACKECKKKAPAPGPHVETITTEDGELVEVACVEGRIVTDPGGRLYKGQRVTDESPEEFKARILQDIGINPDKYFQRGTVVRMASEQIESARDTWEVAKQIRESQKLGRWPRNPDACDAYGSFCSYFSVCAGETTLDDPTLFRDSSAAHEELGGEVAGKRRLPLVTTSSQKAYRSCQRKYFYSYEKRRRSIKESNALRFGTLMHLALEPWWKTVDLDAAMAAILAGESDPFERAKAEALMVGYHVRWADEPLHVLAVEKEFVAPLTNPDTGSDSVTWQRGGKIDAIVRVGDVADVAA